MPDQPSDQAGITDAIAQWLRRVNQPNPVRSGIQSVQAFENDPAAQLKVALGVLDPTQITRLLSTPLIDQAPKPEAPLSEYTGEMGKVAGRWLDSAAPTEPIARDTSPYAVAANGPAPEEAPSTAWEDALGAFGHGIPSLVSTAPLLELGPVGLGLGAIKQGAETYGDTGQLLPSAISAAALPLGVAGVNKGADLAAKAFLRSTFPDAVSLAAQPTSQAFGKAGIDALRTTVDPQAALGLGLSRFAGGVAGGTVSGEATRQAQSFADTGQFTLPSLTGLATDVASNIAMTSPLLRRALGNPDVVTPGVRGERLSTEAMLGRPAQNGSDEPYVAMQKHVAKTIDEAQGLRTQKAWQDEAYQAERGQRIAQAHKDIFDTVERGGNPLPAVAALKAHWDEAAPEPTPAAGLSIMNSFSEEAAQGGLPDETFQRIIAGVQGRYADHFKADPSLPGPETLNTLVQRGLLPKLTKDKVSEIYFNALQQSMGDLNAAKEFTLNTLVAHYEERLPGALEAMRAQPVQEGLSRQALNAQTEADKDATYINAILKLYPHMKNAKSPDGQMSLAMALYQRDGEMSQATQGNQLASSSSAWAQYDAFKDAVIKLADTYDPATRSGNYTPFKRMSDQTIREFPMQKLSIENLVAREGGTTNGKYTFNATPDRKVRGQSQSRKHDAVDDAAQFVMDRFKPSEQGEEDIRTDPEKFIAERAKLVGSGTAEEAATEDLAKRLGSTDEPSADELVGMSPTEIAAYREQQQAVQGPALGVDIGATNKESYYDIALHLMNKVDKTTNAELWDQYGGAKLFGKGAQSPGKFQLFKDAIMARMESEMDDTGQLSAAQTTFFKKWAENVAQKTGAPLKLGNTWEEKRAQFRHAQRLYWGQGTGKVSMPDLFMEMLADKPKYQAMLRAQKFQGADSQTSGPYGYWMDRHANLLPVNKWGEHNAVAKNLLLPTDQTTPVPADTILKRGFVRVTTDQGQLYVDATTPWTSLSSAQQKQLTKLADDRHLSIVYNGRWLRDPITGLTSLSASGSDTNATEKAVVPTGNFVGATGLSNPLQDALRLGRGYARSLGLPTDVADEFANMLGKAVSIFDETAGYTKMVTTSQTNLGANAALSTQSGPVSSVNFDLITKLTGDPMRALVRVLQTTAHELAHNYSDSNYQFVSSWRKQRVDAYSKLRYLMNDLGADASRELLNEIIPQVMLPDSLRKQMALTSLESAPGGNQFDQEAVSRLMEHVMLGVLSRDNPWQTKQLQKADMWGVATKWLPDEVQAVMHLAMRDMTNMLGAIKHYYKNRPYQKGDIKVMSYLEPMMQFANEYLDTNVQELAEMRTVAQNLMAKLTEAGSADWADPTMVKLPYQFDNAKMVELAREGKISMSRVEEKDAVEAQQLMFGGDKLVFEHEKRMGTTVPPWSKYAGLFYQALRRYQKSGVTIANDVMRMVNDLEPSYFRLTRLMHDPFLAYDDKGRLQYDPNNPVLQLLQGTGAANVRARGKLNDLYLWQNKNAKPVMKDGQVNPEAAQMVKETLGTLPPTDQQAVLEGLTRLTQGYTKAADIAYHSQVEGTANRLAGVFMTKDKATQYDVAARTAKLTTEAATQVQSAQNALKAAQKTPLLVPQRQQELQIAKTNYLKAMEGLSGPQIAAADSYLFGNEGRAAKLIDLNDFFTKRQDWFGSESRPGKIFIISTMPDAEGTKHYTSAANVTEAKRVAKELSAQGHTGFQFIDKSQRNDFDLFNSPDAVVNNFLKLEAQSWKHFLDAIKTQLSQEDYDYLDKLGYTPGEASQKYLDNKAVERYMQKRELLPGRERLDAFEVFRDYTGRMSGSVARKSLKQRLDLLLKDPRVRLDNEFKQTVNEAINSLMTPIDEKFIAARAGMTAYFLGMPNFVGPMVEATQSSTTILPYLVDEAGGFAAGVKAYGNALVAPAKLRGLGQDLESKILLQRATMKEAIDPEAMTKDEAQALYYKRANDEGSFQYGPIYSATLSRDHQMLTQQAFGLGKSTPKTREQLITDPLYWAAQKTMYMYSHMSAYNNRIAFLSGLDVMYEKGLRGTELYQAAQAFKNIATFGGGKANSIGFVSKLSNPTTRSAFSLIESLQRYTFGQTTMYKDMLGDVLGNTDLTPKERVAAGKALTTATLAQLLLAGALGIPGMAIGLAVLKNLTGRDPKQALRELETHIAKGLGADDELAVTMANYAQNGLASNMLGVDLSNRVSNNSILGFNQFDGFNANDMFGATGGLIQRMIEGTKFVAQGQMVQAGKAMAPPSWTPYFDLGMSKAQYGDFALRDKSNRMITPLSNGEAATYALGLKPQRFRYIKDQQEALKASADSYNQVRDHKLDTLSQDLLRGNTQSTLDHIRTLRTQDPTILPRETARSVIDRAVASTHPVDPLATQPVGNEQAARQIAASFGNVSPRQSEVQDSIAREKLNAQLGYLGGPPLTPQQFQRAELVDSLTAKGMTKGEASRVVELSSRH